jgi:hypothetical protein
LHHGTINTQFKFIVMVLDYIVYWMTTRSFFMLFSERRNCWGTLKDKQLLDIYWTLHNIFREYSLTILRLKGA